MAFFEGTIAVVGASEKRIAAQVFATLNKQYDDVIPVNPKCESILGIPCVASLKDIDRPIDTVVMIVNPGVGRKVIDDIIDLKIRKVWFQPGAESHELTKICDKHNMACSTDVCLMHL